MNRSVSNQNLQSTVGAFIFGHQPPNITSGHDKLAKERETDKMSDTLASDAADSFCTTEGMEIAEGQENTIGGDGANVVGLPDEGMPLDQ